MQLYRTAPILVICFNRFKSHNLALNEKMNDKINFPVYGLDMAPYVLSCQEDADQNSNGPLIYDLHGVINHYGELNYGHYTAMARNSEAGDQWFNYNDSVVTKIGDSDSEIVTDAAYVLFYKLRDFEYTKMHK